MAIDHTPPRLRLIATIATIVVITLISLDFVFRSYFAYMSSEAKNEKNAPKAALLAQNESERRAMTASKLGLEQAMKQVVSDARPAMIDPKASDDMGAMTGWSKMPKPAPVAPVIPVLLPAQDGGTLSADGGALATDGGAGATSTDAGPTKKDHAPEPAPHH